MPVSGICCGLSGALSAIVREPNRRPADVGVKVTVMAQLAPAFTLLPQLFVSAKSPDAAIFETASACGARVGQRHCLRRAGFADRLRSE